MEFSRTPTGVVFWRSLSLLQGIFPTQGSNTGHLHCRQILYQLSHKGSPGILEWVAYLFSSGSSQPRDWTQVSCNEGRFFTRPRSPTVQADSLPAGPQGKPRNTWVGNLSLLQWIFLTQELNLGLLNCRQILYQLSYQGSPIRLKFRKQFWESSELR